METSKKVWIRGNNKRKEEVIKMLTDLGATNPFNNDGHGKGKIIYFINHNNEIQPAYNTGNEFMEIIKQKNEFREKQKKCHIIFTDGDECEFTGSRVFQKLREIDDD